MIRRNTASLMRYSPLALLLVASPAMAQVQPEGMLDDVLERYQAVAAGWANVFTHHATILFWGLAAISMIWTFGLMALKRVDLGEFATELIRFVIFAGFYWWLLLNGPTIGLALINGLRSVGAEASGLPNDLSPSGIVDIGFDIFRRVVAATSGWHPIDSLFQLLCGLGILVVLALVGVNMLLLLASAYILAYAGVIFLGFGGSRWTSDMAINYFKTVLAVGASLMTMVLIVGIGKTFLDTYYTSAGVSMKVQDLGTMLVFCIVLLALVNKVPGMVAGVITGGSIGAIGSVGGFGAGAAMGAASMAAAAAATGGAAIAAGAANAVGGGQAIAAAYKAAQADIANSGAGTALTSATDGAAPSESGDTPGGAPGGGGSPMDQAMGSPSGSPSSASNDNGGSADGATGEAGTATGGGDAAGGETGGGSAGGGAAGATAAGGEAGGGSAAGGGEAGGGEAGGGEAGGGEAGGGEAGGGSDSGAAGAAAAGGAFGASMGAAKILAKNAGGMVGDAIQGRIDRSAGGKLAARIKAASAGAAPPAATPDSVKSDAAKANPEPLAPANGLSSASNSSPNTETAPAGGSDGGALDGDGGPSEAIGADPGGFGGDAISGSARQSNPSSNAGEVDDFVNRGRAHDAG